MVKPPVVYTAGLLRGLQRGVDTAAWVWLDYLAGQQLFYPPNVAGWDASRWLDTGTFRGRWEVAAAALAPTVRDENGNTGVSSQPARMLDRALLLSGRPSIARETRAALLEFAGRAVDDAGADPSKATYPVMALNAIRQLVAVAPEAQSC
jgi:hypothetical protein